MAEIEVVKIEPLIVTISGGNVTTTAMVAGKPVVVGLNAYIKK